MREDFPGWYARTPEELTILWDTALFVPDANVLLHCIRHPAKVRDELLRVFTVLRESLWIPHQVGAEFHRNRLDVEIGAEDMYAKLVGEFETILNQAREKLRQMRAHPIIEIESEIDVINAFLAQFKDRMDEAKSRHPSAEIKGAVHKLTELLEGRVGEKWPADRLAAVHKEGEERYGRKIPPGYKDAKNKDGDEKYGDLIIWRAMIDKAKADERPIIFISDDVKEDWWWLHRGRKLGPRPELVEEFKALTGQDFHIYEFTNFLRVAGERHQEIKETVELVSQSLLGDERARRRAREARELDDLRRQISDLEDERERIVHALSGSPTLESERASIDRSALRSRLDELNSQLSDLSVRLQMEPEETVG